MAFHLEAVTACLEQMAHCQVACTALEPISTTYGATSFFNMQLLNNTEEIAALYRELSQFPSLSSACIGPEITTQYGGKYCNIYTGTTGVLLVSESCTCFIGTERILHHCLHCALGLL